MFTTKCNIKSNYTAVIFISTKQVNFVTDKNYSYMFWLMLATLKPIPENRVQNRPILSNAFED